MKNIKYFLKKKFPVGSTGRWIITGFFSHPLRFAPSLMKSLLATRKLTGNFLPVCVRVSADQQFIVCCSAGAKISIKGNITVSGWGNDNSHSSLSCSYGGRLEILGDFEIGPGVHITVFNDAILKIGGSLHSTGSGITCNSRIMVEKYIEIGADVIMAWNVFISDSDWHDVKGSVRSEPVYIGDHVWLGHDVSVLKGSIIPSGCIVGAKSLVTKKKFPNNALLAGAPAIVRRTEVEWSR